MSASSFVEIYVFDLAKMLLNQFKTGSFAASSLGGSRGSAAVLRKVRDMGKPETVKVTASSGSESASSPGWLETNLGKVSSFVDKKLHGDGSGAASPGTVEYKGTAVAVKKLKVLDVVDRIADVQDDASELLGKRISIQLMSSEIDPCQFIEPNPCLALSTNF